MYISDERSQRIRNIAGQYNCTLEDAERYLNLLDEGHSRYEARVMSGLQDPDEVRFGDRDEN